MKVLVVDNDTNTAEVVGLCFAFRWPDAKILSAADSESALKLIDQESPDLVISEVILPGYDGFKFCREIRLISSIPIILLSDRQKDIDIAMGLEAGADDYMPKPFSHIELLARVNAVLRRVGFAEVTQPQVTVISSDLRVDLLGREVYKGDRYISFTPIEFRILACLAKNAGRVVPYQAILEQVWGPDRNASTYQLKVHIHHVRQKLEGDEPHRQFIVTEWRTGYKFEVHPLVEGDIVSESASTPA